MAPSYFLRTFYILLLPLEHRASVKRSFHLSFLIFKQSVGFLGRGMNPSQDLYIHRGQHKHRISVHTLNIHARGEIRTQNHGVRASEDSSCPRPLGYRDRLASERAKTVHALDRSATVTGNSQQLGIYYCYVSSCFQDFAIEDRNMEESG
jgi:hypothetical protein